MKLQKIVGKKYQKLFFKFLLSIASLKVFSRRQCIVIGPTPPGTGVIALTLGKTLA